MEIQVRCADSQGFVREAVIDIRTEQGELNYGPILLC